MSSRHKALCLVKNRRICKRTQHCWTHDQYCSSDLNSQQTRRMKYEGQHCSNPTTQSIRVDCALKSTVFVLWNIHDVLMICVIDYHVESRRHLHTEATLSHLQNQWYAGRCPVGYRQTLGVTFSLLPLCEQLRHLECRIHFVGAVPGDMTQYSSASRRGSTCTSGSSCSSPRLQCFALLVLYLRYQRCKSSYGLRQRIPCYAWMHWFGRCYAGSFILTLSCGPRDTASCGVGTGLSVGGC
ncbi:hypothetical protein BC835DRAFT_715318 [Cytidiella melzeri]|nr:hypothetical protein BC835DRAFT_715318 [Cytidiella melzeri]